MYNKIRARKEESKINNLNVEQEKRIQTNSIIPFNIKEKEFNMLMDIYREALENVVAQLTNIKEKVNEIYGYDIINNITSRIKTPQSIVNKMRKKHYKLNYKNLIEKINDIAGIRIICPLKNDIYAMIKILEKIPNINILIQKDYISKPKESGYSGYHLIIETPVTIEGQKINVKVEIQLRTMAMDFWATNEHKMKYKTNKKLSFIDSRRLTLYAKILNIIDDKIMKLHQKQFLKEIAN